MVDERFRQWHDAILIVSSGEKEVSSSAGHRLMNGHFYEEGRLDQAYRHLLDLISAMESGDEKDFVRIVENEALSLHGLMLSSNPSYLLMAPGTIQIIQKIRRFREQFDIPVCFSLDAGPNIHMLYPASSREPLKEFIKNELIQHCENGYWIDDKIGMGPERLD
jgi:diphosphomevalonate decarboxylase